MSWSEPEYQVLESDGRVMLQLVKDKRIAQRLELVVTVLTVEEAEVLGCDSVNTPTKTAGIRIAVVSWSPSLSFTYTYLIFYRYR